MDRPIVRIPGFVRPLVLLGLVSFSTPAPASATQVETITSEDIVRRIGILAHDSMGGRNTPSPGLEMAASYVTNAFRAMGVEPAGTVGFEQRYDIRVTRPDPNNTNVTYGLNANWEYGRDFVMLRRSFSEVPATGTAVVLWGPPRQAAELERLSLAGKTIIVFEEETARGIDRFNPAAIVIAAPLVDIIWTRTINSSVGSLIDPADAPRTTRPPRVLVRRTLVDSMLAAHGVTRSAFSGKESGHVDIVQLRLTISHPMDRVSAPNIVGVVRGSHPTLRNEFVVVSAHMDHIGTAGDPFADCNRSRDDPVCNGADDDASGVSAMLEIAEAVSGLSRKPDRSFLFLAVSGEEKGLWGSDHFAANPTVPLENMVADLNIDMVGRNWPDTIVAIGKEHSDLGATLERVNLSHPELGMAAIDDRWPGERFYFRSDHFNFARRGVPILFFFNGTHRDYHRASDELELIDGDKTARIARLIFYLGMDIANADERPRWNPASIADIVDSTLR